MIDLPDLRVLRVETEINEVDISKIALGQNVEIRLDAFSDTLFHGTVTEIAALAKIKDQEKKSKIKVFPVKILVEGTSKKLMPGMTVSNKIIVDKMDDVLFIPLEAVQKDADQDYVYLKKGGDYRRRDVVTGESNNDFVIIKEGLTEKDVVALANPFEKETAKGETP